MMNCLLMRMPCISLNKTLICFGLQVLGKRIACWFFFLITRKKNSGKYWCWFDPMNKKKNGMVKDYVRKRPLRFQESITLSGWIAWNLYCKNGYTGAKIFT